MDPQYSARRRDAPELFGARAQIPGAVIERLLSAVDANFTNIISPDGSVSHPTPLREKWSVVSGRSNTAIPEAPSGTWESTGTAGDALTRDLRAMSDLAFRYQVYRNEADAEGACRFLSNFASMTSMNLDESDNKLHFSENWGIVIQAATWVQDSEHYTSSLDGALVATSLALRNQSQTAFTFQYPNNWVAWGLSCDLAIAGFVGDRQMHDNAVYRFRQYFREGIKSQWTVKQPNSSALGQKRDNVAIWEVYRSDHGTAEVSIPGQTTNGGVARNRSDSIGNGAYGLLYNNHALNGLVTAAEWARLNGSWLYDTSSSDGSSLEGWWGVVSETNRYVRNTQASAGPVRTDVMWYNVTGTSFDRFPSRGVRRFYWSRCYAFTNLAQSLWPNANGTWLYSQPFRNTSSGTTALSYLDSPDADIDHNGMRHTEFLYRLGGLWPESLDD